MRKKLDTRFPAARIKKIMQSDEDVGKIAMAVPLLVSKALELFLQDLCDRTYEVTLKRGAKTMSSSHLKQCVQSFNVFDFLREIVRRVPDLGGPAVDGDDQPGPKRRKLADDEDDGGEESIRGKNMHGTGHTNGGGRGSGRGRGRGRGRRSRANVVDKFEDDPDIHDELHDLHSTSHDEAPESLLGMNTEAPVRNFDLNLDLNEDGNASSMSALGPDSTDMKSVPDMTHDLYPSWSLGEIENMVIDPIRLASLNRPIEEDENYDEDG